MTRCSISVQRYIVFANQLSDVCPGDGGPCFHGLVSRGSNHVIQSTLGNEERTGVVHS